MVAAGCSVHFRSASKFMGQDDQSFIEHALAFLMAWHGDEIFDERRQRSIQPGAAFVNGKCAARCSFATSVKVRMVIEDTVSALEAIGNPQHSGAGVGQFTPPKGDYESVPLNAVGKKLADAWDPA